MKVVVECPAKVNTFLAVGKKDEIGYHPLRTVFQSIDLCDTLTIEQSIQTQVICDWTDLPNENTLTKAYRLLSEIVSLPPLRIELQKRIPAQSGLGGGSSDAAGLIKGALKFAPSVPSLSDLNVIALAVGADVPFFLVGGRAKAEGYGEKLVPLDDVPVQWMVIARPNVDCPTVKAYQALDELDYPWADWSEADKLYNDFERVAPWECLRLKESLIESGAHQAVLTGSGSAVFGLAFNQNEADCIEAAVRNSNPKVRTWVVRTLSRNDGQRIKVNR